MNIDFVLGLAVGAAVTFLLTVFGFRKAIFYFKEEL